MHLNSASGIPLPDDAARSADRTGALSGGPPAGQTTGASDMLAQLRLLNRIAQLTAGTLDLMSILDTALHELNRHLPLHVCAVWLLESAASLGSGSKHHPVKAPEGVGVRNDDDHVDRRSGLSHRKRAQQPEPSGDEGNGSAPLPAPAAPAAPRNTEPESLELATVSSAPLERAEKLGLTQGFRLPLEQSPFAACLGKGQAQHDDLVKPDALGSALLARLAAGGAISSFAVPLRGAERIIGILQSICLRADGFTNQQVQLLYLVADLLGPAISNCQLFRRLRRAYEELRYTQSQLIQAEKMRALGELAGGMAHDFNNSLCGVLGFLELALASREVPAALRGLLESARTCSLDAAQTVRRVQNFARWQRHELSVQILDLNELVRQTVELTRPRWESLAHARGISIQVQTLTEARTRLAGSAAELREVLTNLIFNAVDAMPRGGELALRTWSTSSDVYLSVQDTGVGMTDSVRKRLFEPFFTTKGERGNGLGLSVTFGIVQRYGGEISVTTAVGRGSTFTVRLPVRPEPSSPPQGGEARGTTTNGQEKRNPGSSSLRARSSLAARPARSLRILVVEDETAVRQFLHSGLTHLGHRPDLAADASQAVAALAQERYDLVLTDLGLPGASGEDVARAVARQSPQTPVILLTGWSSQLQSEGHQVEGVTRILGKPVTLNALAEAVNSLCPV
jgi:signal transduction histidine kinase/CheY-like chemotaxis protein